MRCDVICLVACEFVLGIVFRRVMRVAFILKISNVYKFLLDLTDGRAGWVIIRLRVFRRAPEPDLFFWRAKGSAQRRSASASFQSAIFPDADGVR